MIVYFDYVIRVALRERVIVFDMPSFRSRNALYLRIDPQTILPVFLHLDEQNGHTEWMSQSVLEQVVEDMRYL